ncbi:hypothetical protein GF1_11560 [Desulfolithobacter dissulfuricans]|uniref:diguanylate cyclase n=1 Tax=Desulfolithobacter dissulfuricans TaxID=2795293 RepID=A0A915U9W2_9BACT|nr:sensor domain-containing diguanylate cyclase [Desulfolithobacter dissulfuricans]BCO08780.1 hypothetical protein GF1_11560 [Desulfolithobacter dissulfuricans]
MTIPGKESKLSLWRRLWQPFFDLSVYGKFILILSSFLLGFLLVGLYNFYFVNNLKKQLIGISHRFDSPEISQIVNAFDSYLLTGALLVTGVMIILTITSFLCVQALVSLLHDMTARLEALRKSTGDNNDCSPVSEIPIISHDEIGTVAKTVNGLIADIRNVSLFRRTIEADETADEVYKRLAYVFRDRLGLSTFIIWEIRDNGEAITPVYSWPPELEDETCQMSAANTCRAKRTGEVVMSSGYPGICPVFPLADIMTHTCVPMMVGGQVLGVVQFLFPFVNSPEREAYLKRSLHRAQQYLREALPVLHAKQLAENLHQMAIRDTMTGLYNRRFLEGNINPLIARIRRRDSHLAILMCDMDYFKKVNDEHGHEAGDMVLTGIAHILQNCVRSSDLVIRYGGEEFLILLVDCQPDDGVKVAEKIRATVEENQFRFGGIVLRKTISVGISVFPDDTSAFWEAVKFADVALYRAKETGRNRVVRFDSSMWEGPDY